MNFIKRKLDKYISKTPVSTSVLSLLDSIIPIRDIQHKQKLISTDVVSMLGE
jgi:hypothetical protein